MGENPNLHPERSFIAGWLTAAATNLPSLSLKADFRVSVIEPTEPIVVALTHVDGFKVVLTVTTEPL